MDLASGVSRRGGQRHRRLSFGAAMQLMPAFAKTEALQSDAARCERKSICSGRLRSGSADPHGRRHVRLPRVHPRGGSVPTGAALQRRAVNPGGDGPRAGTVSSGVPARFEVALQRVDRCGRGKARAPCCHVRIARLVRPGRYHGHAGEAMASGLNQRVDVSGTNPADAGGRFARGGQGRSRPQRTTRASLRCS
jgi:hypothetical protein